VPAAEHDIETLRLIHADLVARRARLVDLLISSEQDS